MQETFYTKTNFYFLTHYKSLHIYIHRVVSEVAGKLFVQKAEATRPGKSLPFAASCIFVSAGCKA